MKRIKSLKFYRIYKKKTLKIYPEGKKRKKEKKKRKEKKRKESSSRRIAVAKAKQ